MNPEKILQLTESVYRTLENLQQYCRSECQNQMRTPQGSETQSQHFGSWTPWMNRSHTGYGSFPYYSTGSFTGGNFPWGYGSQFWGVPGFNVPFGTCAPYGCYPNQQSFATGFGTGSFPAAQWGNEMQNTQNWGTWNPWFFGNSTTYPGGNWFGNYQTPWGYAQSNPFWYPTNWSGQNFQGPCPTPQPVTTFGTTPTPQPNNCDMPHCA